MALKDLFALAGTITVDSSGAIKNIDNATNAAKQSESKFERSFQTIKNLALTYLSTTAIFNFGKSMVEAAANVQAETAQFEAAFKDLSGSATEAFARLEESTGTLSSRLQVTGTKAFSQFTGAGMESAEALKQMEGYLQLATDGAAYYDMSLEEVDERLRSFLRGNTEAGDAIGLFTSEKQRDTKANEMYGKSFTKLTEEQKQLVMLDISKGIYEASGATGQAAREADGYANVVGNLKEQWRQFLANIGAPLLEAVIPILKNLGDLLQPLAVKIKEISQWLVDHKDIILAVAAGVGAMIAAYGAYKLVLMAVNTYQKISNTLQALAAGYSALKTGATLKEAAATAVAAAAQKGLNIAMLASPLTWIIAGIGLLVAAFVLLWKKCEGFRNFWKNMWAGVKSAAAAAWSGIKSIFSGAKTFFSNLVSSIANAFSGIGSKIASKFSGVVGKIKDKFTGLGGKLFSGVKKLLGFAGGGVFTGESAIRVAEYPNATTNPEIVTPQAIMRDTFAETLDNYTLKTQGGGDNSRVEALLENILNALGQQKVMLSTGELVGALTTRIDKSLGERSDKKARGRV